MSRRRRLLVLLLGLSLVRGFVYLALIPPWQHYDEPTHFEYVRLIVEQDGLPGPDDYRLGMRREIAASMIAHNFWKGQPIPALDVWSDRPPDIGFSELGHPPLYYLLLALPQFLLRHQEVETQLYIARFFSVLLFPLLVLAAYGLTDELAGGRRWLPLAVAAFVALLPPLTDLASGVNNDVGAAVFASLLLWSSVRLLRRGPSWRRVTLTLLLAVACLATKNTAGLVAVTVLFILGVRYLPPLWRRLALIGSAGLAIGFLLAACTLGTDAAHWYSYEPPGAANRLPVESELGSWALSASTGGDHPRRIVQELDLEAGQRLRGKPVTFGAWLQSDDAGGLVVLALDSGSSVQRHAVEPAASWRFHAFTTTVPSDAAGVAASFSLREDPAEDGTVHIDGAVLVEGEFSAEEPPQFDGPGARGGSWAGQSFTNLLLNGSAEMTWPSLRPWLQSRRIYRESASHVLHSLWEWQRTGWVYLPAVETLFHSFWGTFGWNHLALPAGWFVLFGVISAAAMAGAITWLARWRGSPSATAWRRWAIVLLGAVWLLSWGSSLLRVHPVFVAHSHLYWPVARYVAVSIVPTAVALCGGLSVLVPARWRAAAAYAGLLALLFVDLVARWLVIIPYYYG